MLTRQKHLRVDGRVELICIHGVGHTFAIPVKYDTDKDRNAWWSHTCDGCCKQDENGKYNVMSKEAYTRWMKKQKPVKDAD